MVVVVLSLITIVAMLVIIAKLCSYLINYGSGSNIGLLISQREERDDEDYINGPHYDRD